MKLLIDESECITIADDAGKQLVFPKNIKATSSAHDGSSRFLLSFTFGGQLILSVEYSYELLRKIITMDSIENNFRIGDVEEYPAVFRDPLKEDIWCLTSLLNIKRGEVRELDRWQAFEIAILFAEKCGFDEIVRGYCRNRFSK